MATMNVSLPDPMRVWVKTRIDSGEYANASDYVHDRIRQDQREQKIVIDFLVKHVHTMSHE